MTHVYLHHPGPIIQDESLYRHRLASVKSTLDHEYMYNHQRATCKLKNYFLATQIVSLYCDPQPKVATVTYTYTMSSGFEAHFPLKCSCQL